MESKKEIVNIEKASENEYVKKLVEDLKSRLGKGFIIEIENSKGAEKFAFLNIFPISDISELICAINIKPDGKIVHEDIKEELSIKDDRCLAFITNLVETKIDDLITESVNNSWIQNKEQLDQEKLMKAITITLRMLAKNNDIKVFCAFRKSDKRHFIKIKDNNYQNKALIEINDKFELSCSDNVTKKNYKIDKKDSVNEYVDEITNYLAQIDNYTNYVNNFIEDIKKKLGNKYKVEVLYDKEYMQDNGHLFKISIENNDNVIFETDIIYDGNGMRFGEDIYYNSYEEATDYINNQVLKKLDYLKNNENNNRIVENKQKQENDNKKITENNNKEQLNSRFVDVLIKDVQDKLGNDFLVFQQQDQESESHFFIRIIKTVNNDTKEFYLRMRCSGDQLYIDNSSVSRDDAVKIIIDFVKSKLSNEQKNNKKDEVKKINNNNNNNIHTVKNSEIKQDNIINDNQKEFNNNSEIKQQQQQNSNVKNSKINEITPQKILERKVKIFGLKIRKSLNDEMKSKDFDIILVKNNDVSSGENVLPPRIGIVKGEGNAPFYYIDTCVVKGELRFKLLGEVLEPGTTNHQRKIVDFIINIIKHKNVQNNSNLITNENNQGQHI